MIACYKYIWFHCASFKYIFEAELGLFLVRVISISWFRILADVFRNNYVLACSIAGRSAAEMNEMSGYRTVPCLAKMTKHSSTADWIKFQ